MDILDELVGMKMVDKASFDKSQAENATLRARITALEAVIEFAGNCLHDLHPKMDSSEPCHIYEIFTRIERLIGKKLNGNF